MADIKRFRLMDDQGNVIVYDIAAGSITFDDRNMTLPQVVAMLEAAIEVAGQVKSVTLNGTKAEPDENGDVELELEVPEQVQADWEEDNPSDPAYIKHKPTKLSDFSNDEGFTDNAGTVTGVKMNDGNAATPDSNGVVDLGTVITSHQSLAALFGRVAYDGTTHRINFYGKDDVSMTTVLGYIDCSPFIVDGMLSNVDVKNVTINNVSTPCMVFSFNTDAGKQNINIPVSSIFNAANYYTKDDADGRFQLKLVSGTNIKTVNNTSILGEGNITIPAGESAYDIAVDEGFEGTEAQWLASLKGDKGDQGDTVLISETPQEFAGMIVNDLTTGGGGAALSAEMGKKLKGNVDACYRSSSAGDTSTIIEDVEVTLRPGTGSETLGAPIVKGQRRPGTGGMDVLDTANNSGAFRATVNTYYTRTGDNADIPFPDEFKVVLPSGYYVDFVGSDIINANGTNDGVEETGWIENGATVNLSTSANKKYISVNFKNSGNTIIGTSDVNALNTGFAIKYTERREVEVVGPSAGKAIEILNADGTVAKTVYAKNDNSALVQMYTKAAVDSKISNASAIIDGIDRSPVQLVTVHGLRHPIGYEGNASNQAYGINTVKTGNNFVARATSHYFKISGSDLIDMTLVDGGSTEAEATIKGAINDGVIKVILPDGICCLVTHSTAATRVTESANYYVGSWRDAGSVDYDLNEGDAIDYTDFPYIAFNFKNSDNSNFTDDSAAAIGNAAAIVPTGEIVINGKTEAVSIVGTNGTAVSIMSDVDERVEVPTVDKVEQMIDEHIPSVPVIARNEDAINRIWAARKHYDLTHTSDYPVINNENNFCIAHGSDFHVDVDRLENFRDFVDGVESIDAAIITGDFTSNGTDTEFSAMMGVEFERIEPMRCIGNHERDGGKTLAQLATALNMDNDYYVNDDFVADYGIRFIVLNRYDVASTTKAIAQRDGHWSQTQIDWFIGKLDESITNGYHVIVAMHAIDNEVGYANLGKRTAPNDKGFWQRMNAIASNQNTKLTVTSGTVIEDIISAFRTGGSISQSYTFSGNNAPQINVSHTFSGAGKFVCYMVGHCHIDMIGYAVKHPDQLYLVAPTSGCIGKDQSTPPQSYDLGTQSLDLPRVAGTKTEDCFNVYAFDTTNKVVKVVRVGSDMNDLMEKREVAYFEYEPTV